MVCADLAPALTITTLRAIAPELLPFATCPWCHTADATITDDALREGANWQCARCGQRWNAIRLATAAAYAHWLSCPGRRLASALLEMRRAESVAAGEETVRIMNRTFFAEIRRWLEPHLKRGVLKRLPEDLYIAVIGGPSQEFARRWLVGRAKTDIAQAAKVLADAAWNSLRTTRHR